MQKFNQVIFLNKVNKMTDRVEGLVVNEDWKEPTPEEYSVLSNKWRPVRAIFNKLHNELVPIITMDIFNLLF